METIGHGKPALLWPPRNCKRKKRRGRLRHFWLCARQKVRYPFQYQRQLSSCVALSIVTMLVFAALAPFSLSAQSHTQKELRITGNHQFSRKEILALISWNRISAGPAPQETQRALTRLKEAYHSRGFFEIRATLTRSDSSGPVLRINEGPRYRIGWVLITGVEPHEAADLRKQMRLKEGGPFDSRKVEYAIRSLLDYLGNRGYLAARVELVNITPDAHTRTVSLAFRVLRGKRIRFRKLRTDSLRHTNLLFLQQLLRLHPGEILTLSRITEVEQRARKIDYLDWSGAIQVILVGDSLADLYLPFRELDVVRADGALGYNPPTAARKGFLSGTVDFRMISPFGKGKQFWAYWSRRTPESQEMRFQLRFLRPLGLPAGLHLRFEQILQDTLFVRRNTAILLETEFFRQATVILGFRGEQVIADSAARIHMGLPSSSATGVTAELQIDGRNRRINTTRGIFYATRVEILQKRAESRFGTIRNRVQRIRVDLEWYRTVLAQQVLFARVHGAQVKMGDAVPVDEVFRVGGVRSIRGYREEQFWGSHILWGTLEYRFLLDPVSHFALFVDAGWIGWKKKNGRMQTHRPLGYGFGLQTQTPVGLIQFYYGLARGAGFREGMVHLRISTRF